MQCNIIRTVDGDPADPKSTRNLSQIAPEELEHIRLCCEAGILETESYMAMTDDELGATLQGNIAAIANAGMAVPSELPMIDKELRRWLRIRLRACATMLRKVKKSKAGKIDGITPLEYEHLVTSLQAGYREAEVCCLTDNGAIGAAFIAMDAGRERLGLEKANPYAEHRADYHEFFQERAEVLWDVLRCVNEPYEAGDGVTRYAIFA